MGRDLKKMKSVICLIIFQTALSGKKFLVEVKDGPEKENKLSAQKMEKMETSTMKTEGKDYMEGESDHDFPDVVSIWNKDPDASIWSAQKACLGQYSKMPGKSSHGKPVYKNIDRKDRFFFVGANGFWYCSYTYGPTAGGFLAAVKTKGAPRWTRYSFGPKSFIIEGSVDYPDIVSISNTDPNKPLSSYQQTMLGQYSKMPGKYSRGQPVYEHNNRKDRFFFEGVNGFWYTSYTYGPTAGGYIIATWKNGAWKTWGAHMGTQSVIFEGMNIEDMGPG